MNVVKRKYLLMAASTVAIAVTAAACRDMATPGRARVHSPASGHATLASHSSAQPGVKSADVHRRNPMDWVGVQHNLFLEEVTSTMRATKKMPADVCRLAREFTHRSTDPRVRAIDPTLFTKIATRIDDSTVACHWNRQKAKTSTVMFQTPELGVDFHNASSSLDYIGEVATTPEDFATRVAPLLEATNTMNSTDSLGVQVLIAVAQSSYEYWYDGTAHQAYVDQAQSEFQACFDGNAQGVIITANGATYYCDNRQWITSANPSPAPGPQRIKMASYAQPVTLVFKQGGCLGGWSRFKRIFGWDKEGAATGAVVGMVGGPPGMTAGAWYGAQIGSLGSTINEAYGYTTCVMAL